MSRRRAVVIGSGLSGISTAILLAEDGWQVDILERHSIPGGLMQRYRRRDCHFDTGFHLLSSAHPGGPLRAILRRLGTLDERLFIAPDPQAQFALYLPGSPPLLAPAGIEATAKVAMARWPEQAAAIAEFFRCLRGRLAANPWLTSLAEGAAAVELSPGDSVAAVLTRCGVHGAAHATLGAASSILAMRAERCPFDLYATFAGSSFSGSWRMVGGGDGLMQPMLARAKALGARLHLRCPAQRIEHDGTKVQAVVDGRGTRHETDMVVAAIHPHETYRMCDAQGFRPNFQRRMAEIPDSDGAVLLAARLQAPAQSLGRRHHLMRLSDGGDAYVVAPDQWDPRQPPSLEAMVWVPVAMVAAFRDTRLGRRNADYGQWKQQQEQRLLGAIAEHFPDVVRAISHSWTASPLTFRDYLGGGEGGAMGLSHDLDGGLGDGPLSPRNKLRNLLLTGQSIHHPGILGSLIGGCVTAGGILGRDLCAEVFA